MRGLMRPSSQSARTARSSSLRMAISLHRWPMLTPLTVRLWFISCSGVSSGMSATWDAAGQPADLGRAVDGVVVDGVRAALGPQHLVLAGRRRAEDLHPVDGAAQLQH